jgi:hypothetical protein
LGPRPIGGAAYIRRDHRIHVSDEINASAAVPDTALDDLADLHLFRIAAESSSKTR